MSTRSYFSSRVVREANALLVASGARMEVPLPRELAGILTSTKKTRSQLKEAFASAYCQLRKG
ncbi:MULTISPECIES: hypothetical protein [Pseudomonas]|uniref:hypothetical protein n=1 Tax=Pseudomonas TaxID=286 RepID=UPI001596F9D3|nr:MULTISPECIES: hypothetical protein [Pseudomonas]